MRPVITYTRVIKDNDKWIEDYDKAIKAYDTTVKAYDASIWLMTWAHEHSNAAGSTLLLVLNHEYSRRFRARRSTLTPMPLLPLVSGGVLNILTQARPEWREGKKQWQ